LAHTGVCRTVKRFSVHWLEELARRVEADLGDQFRPYGAQLVVRPIRVSHLKTVGEGVQLDLAPLDSKRWTRWGDFENDLEVRQRRRLTRNWEALQNPSEEAWLRSEAHGYLAKLAAD
jgi:hypothetical protein